MCDSSADLPNDARVGAATNAVVGARSRQAAALDAFPDAVLVLDRHGALVECLSTPDAGQPHELLDDTCSRARNVPASALAAQAGAAIRAALDTGTVQSLDLEVQAPGGARSYEVRLRSAGPEHVVALLRDVTDGKREAMEREVMLRIMRIAASGAGHERMIGEMLDEVRALFRLPNLFLALYDPGTDLIGFPYFVDESDPHPEPRPPGRTSTDWILRNRRPLHVGPDEFHALVAAGEMDLVGTPAQAWLGVPLSGHGAAIGALVAQDYHTLDAFGAGTERLMAVAAHHISAALAHERAERRLARLSECLVRFGPDPDANIGLLTGVAGELLGAQCGLYARMRGEKLVVASRWNVPDDLAAAPGCLCADTVAVDRQEALVVRDLPSTAYAQTDPVVAQSGLRTYIGQSVTKGDAPLGVLCALFRGDLEFDSSDRDVLNIIASAIAVEEERRRSADALRHLNATLEHRVTARTGELATALEELHEFCRAVSHDLRAPLRHVDGYARILLEDHGANLDQHGEACIARIREASMNMARLIDGLLALSRVTRSELDPGRRDAGPVAVEILSQLGARDPGRNVETIVERELIVWADAALLRAALECLLNNAWKFTAHAEKAVIEVGATDTSKGRALFVRDNGAGFQMAYARRLFHPFERLHDASDFSGTGMGLAVVHRAVRRHGGEAWAEGEPGRGATFYVRFPEPPDSG